MSEFVYLYRIPPSAPASPREMEERMNRWMAWMKDLDAKGHIVSRGHPLTSGGAVVKDKKGTVSDGPYAETKDIVMGFSVIQAKDLEEANELSRGCPILEGGGVVEVRPIAKM